jgi:hypothetical protein
LWGPRETCDKLRTTRSSTSLAGRVAKDTSYTVITMSWVVRYLGAWRRICSYKRLLIRLRIGALLATFLLTTTVARYVSRLDSANLIAAYFVRIVAPRRNTNRSPFCPRKRLRLCITPFYYFDRRMRCLRRRALSTRWPVREAMRLKKPCSRLAARFLGWYVRFGMILHPYPDMLVCPAKLPKARTLRWRYVLAADFQWIIIQQNNSCFQISGLYKDTIGAPESNTYPH